MAFPSRGLSVKQCSAAKPLQAVSIGGHVWWQDLESHVPPELRVFGPTDLAHAALAKLGGDRVVGECGADHQSGQSERKRVPCRPCRVPLFDFSRGSQNILLNVLRWMPQWAVRASGRLDGVDATGDLPAGAVVQEVEGIDATMVELSV